MEAGQQAQAGVLLLRGRRCLHDIIAEVLEVAAGGSITLSGIMYQVSLRYDMTKPILTSLVQVGFLAKYDKGVMIRGKRYDGYVTTDSGRVAMKAYKTLDQALHVTTGSLLPTKIITTK